MAPAPTIGLAIGPEPSVAGTGLRRDGEERIGSVASVAADRLLSGPAIATAAPLGAFRIHRVLWRAKRRWCPSGSHRGVVAPPTASTVAAWPSLSAIQRRLSLSPAGWVPGAVAFVT